MRGVTPGNVQNLKAYLCKVCRYEACSQLYIAVSLHLQMLWSASNFHLSAGLWSLPTLPLYLGFFIRIFYWIGTTFSFGSEMFSGGKIAVWPFHGSEFVFFIGTYFCLMGLICNIKSQSTILNPSETLLFVTHIATAAVWREDDEKQRPINRNLCHLQPT